MELELPPWPYFEKSVGADGDTVVTIDAKDSPQMIAALRARLALAVRNLERMADGIPLAANHPDMANMRTLIAALKEPS